MRVGVMIVRVSNRFVPMPVAVPGSWSDGRVVLVRMVQVVFVFVLVLHRLVGMPVDVMLGKMQPNAKPHQKGSDSQPPG